MHLGQLWAVLPQVDVLQADMGPSWKTVQVRGVACDSRCIVPGDVFVAVAGSRYHGCRFVADAVRQGAVAVMVDQDIPERTILAEAGPCVPVARVPDPRKALALLAHVVGRQPSHKLDVIGVTGTNGKTTTAKMVQSILVQAGRKPAFLGTVGYEIGERRLPAPTTTPPSPDLVRFLQDAITRGHDYVVMEVSSHALDQHRVTGTRFRAAGFTGFSRDHQEYHGDMQRYFECKRRLFEMLEMGRPSVINVADPAGRRLQDELRSQGRRVMTCGMQDADVHAEHVSIDATGSRFWLRTPVGGRELRCPLPGRYNVANAVTAAGIGVAVGLELDAIVRGLEQLPPVAGRMERFPVPERDAMVVVDYAHTHVGLASALKTLAEVGRSRGQKSGRLVVVFGCGEGSRPGAGVRAWGRWQHGMRIGVIVTSDNSAWRGSRANHRGHPVGYPGRPRPWWWSRTGGSRSGSAVQEATAGDVILVAGKGHEDYQIFKDVTVPFDDRDQVRRAIHELRGDGALAGGPAVLVQGVSGQGCVLRALARKGFTTIHDHSRQTQGVNDSAMAHEV